MLLRQSVRNKNIQARTRRIHEHNKEREMMIRTWFRTPVRVITKEDGSVMFAVKVLEVA
jgi:hypothetical protein